MTRFNPFRRRKLRERNDFAAWEAELAHEEIAAQRAEVVPSVAGVPVLRPRDTGFFRGDGTWPALENGECCCCGHEWAPGEIIGLVTQAYERLDDGTVRRSPGMRLACCVCVERQRATGDLSIAWARDAGLLSSREGRVQ